MKQEDMRKIPKIGLALVSIAAVAVPLLGTSMVSASDDVDVTISWESQEILDSSGDSVDIVWVQEDSAQEMGVGELPGGERVEVTKQAHRV
ncbi:MAG: hypothetical protein ACTMIR_15295 [Cellulomonadaceae bacterium]